MEVVIAVGVVAVAIVAILGLLPSLNRQAAESADQLTAQHLADGLAVELQIIVDRDGLGALATSAPVMRAPLEGGLAFVAPRSGVPLRPSAGAASTEEDYFLVEVWRFNSGPLAHTPGSAVLPLYARVSWPHRLKGVAVPVASSDRTQVGFALAVNP
ncbi:hypothetical protein Oter_3734 [Opitutus terrae PB90-1]|uniref:Uncharacterized protein n=1 Tax=Opitutus terrae (strain DSM 11246 / JCM 15787 / PB90-1) TaxID=452637 RepID=B1ZYB1_OPITP|nr:hypothetical protein Oter_3734 [Opitutus terrae PB90-1]